MFAKATANNKEVSEKSETLTITYDDQKPKITIMKPNNNEQLSGVDSRIKVTGNVDEPASMQINSHLVITDSSGNFDTVIGVKDGENIIKFMAKDLAGNETSTSIKIHYDKR